MASMRGWQEKTIDEVVAAIMENFPIN